MEPPGPCQPHRTTSVGVPAERKEPEERVVVGALPGRLPSAPSSPAPCPSRLRQPWQAREKRCSGNSSLCREMDQDLGLWDAAQVQSAPKGGSVLVQRLCGQRVLQALFHVTHQSQGKPVDFNCSVWD